MDVRQLRYFSVIVKARTFTKAADILRIAQPALSAQIRNLEDELQTQLLMRHSRGVEPTEAGKVLLSHAQTILAQVEKARIAVQEMQTSPRGKVVLGVTPSTDVALTAEIIERTSVEFPDIQLNIVESISTHLADRVRDGEVDLALIYDIPVQPRDLVIDHLMKEELVFIHRQEKEASSPIRFEEAAQSDLILSRPPHAIRDLIERTAQQFGLTLSVPFEVHSVSTAFAMVERGIGCAILPMGAASRRPIGERVQIRTIIEPRISVTLSLAHSAVNLLTPAELALKSLVARLVRKV